MEPKSALPCEKPGGFTMLFLKQHFQSRKKKMPAPGPNHQDMAVQVDAKLWDHPKMGQKVAALRYKLRPQAG